METHNGRSTERVREEIESERERLATRPHPASFAGFPGVDRDRNAGLEVHVLAPREPARVLSPTRQPRAISFTACTAASTSSGVFMTPGEKRA